MSKLGNCLKMAKSGKVFVKPTLELNSRSMDEIRVQEPLQHESMYVCLHSQGIGGNIGYLEGFKQKTRSCYEVSFLLAQD
ncbi:unnamed protein product [Linum trigynum]|uniref:Uncharacterized protein n=1 Tax=Linum trigynum TaxID=586398 RepID=A0AAV2D7N3_9ROSI